MATPLTFSEHGSVVTCQRHVNSTLILIGFEGACSSVAVGVHHFESVRGTVVWIFEKRRIKRTVAVNVGK